MGITIKQAKELAKSMLRNLPRPAIENLIGCGVSDPDEVGYVVDYIKNHYSVKEVLDALDGRFRRFRSIVSKFKEESA